MRERRRIVAITTAVIAVVCAGVASRADARVVAPTIAAKTCTAHFVRAVIGGRIKCLHAGEFCATRYESSYRRYGFACISGRLRATRRAVAPRITYTKFMSPDENIVCFGSSRDVTCGTQDNPIEIKLSVQPFVRPSPYDTRHLMYTGGATLDYGQTWAAPPFACTLTTKGMRCSAAVSVTGATIQHGFVMNSEGVTTW